KRKIDFLSQWFESSNQNIMHPYGFGNQAFDLREDGAFLIGHVECLRPNGFPRDKTGINQLSQFALYRSESNIRKAGELAQIEHFADMAIQDGKHSPSSMSE